MTLDPDASRERVSARDHRVIRRLRQANSYFPAHTCDSLLTSAGGRIAGANDWHGNVEGVRRVITVLRDREPEIETIFQLGDFGCFPHRPGNEFVTEVDSRCTAAGIRRVIVTPGNHEDWDELDKRSLPVLGRRSD